MASIAFLLKLFYDPCVRINLFSKKGCLMMARRFLLPLSFFSLVLTGCHSDKHAGMTSKVFDLDLIFKQNPSIKPVVVIGGGVAGLTAANYLLQANIPCLLLEGAKPGGALAQSDSVRNWPGVLDAPGANIMNSLKDQVIRNGAVVLSSSLLSITQDQQLFTLGVRDDAGNEEKIQTLTCIVAMGAEPNYLGVPGESGIHGYWGRGISNCAVCDGALFKDKVVAVVGGGDSAIVEAAYLAGIAKKVYLLIRRDVLRARDIRKVGIVKALPNVSFMYDVGVTAVHGDGKTVTSVDIVNNKTKQFSTLAIDGLFLAIGAKPKTQLFEGLVELDAAKYIVLRKGQETSVPGIFAAGDICDPVTKQAVTSSAMGCKAALEAKEYLEDLGYIPAAQETKKISTAEEKSLETVPSKLEHDELVCEINSLAHAKKMFATQKLVVVDVYGDFCMPCKKMAPIVDELAKKYKEFQFAKLNIANRLIDIDAFASMIRTDQIMQVPTFLFIKNGVVVDRHIGMMSQDSFSKLIDKNK